MCDRKTRSVRDSSQHPTETEVTAVRERRSQTSLLGLTTTTAAVPLPRSDPAALAPQATEMDFARDETHLSSSSSRPGKRCGKRDDQTDKVGQEESEE